MKHIALEQTRRLSGFNRLLDNSFALMPWGYLDAVRVWMLSTEDGTVVPQIVGKEHYPTVAFEVIVSHRRQILYMAE